jgi:predicted LPLAT superfamily acyltransferase
MYTQHAERINSLFASLDALSPGRSVRVEVMKAGGFERVLGAKRVIERGEVLSILADRVHPDEERRVSRVSFLGSLAAFPQGPFLLAGLLGCPVLLMVGVRTGKRSYEIRVERLADRLEFSRHDRKQKIDEFCQQFAARLEAHCVQTPFQWFNFYDFWSEAGSDGRQ